LDRCDDKSVVKTAHKKPVPALLAASEFCNPHKCAYALVGLGTGTPAFVRFSNCAILAQLFSFLANDFCALAIAGRKIDNRDYVTGGL
jgi:hypothetical protein